MEKDRNDKNIGKKLDGRYEITELIGEGGMADVYRANDVVDQKTVAVKILKKELAENEEFLRRFRNESKAIALLSHPNIVKIYDVGFSDRIQFIVMEYIDGITLNEYMEQGGPLDWKDAVHFIMQILRALQHAHSKGIVHRDIKPQNIMMLRDGTIKVMDFGIAKFAREDGKTGTDKAIGTVHYISPEQARGADTDAKSDLYSVGVMLYEMLTGKKPFDTDNPVSIAVMHMQTEAPRPRSIRPDIAIGLEEIIRKAMRKDPADRYQSAREMMDDIELFKEDPGIVFGYFHPQDADGDDSKTRFFTPVTETGDEESEPYQEGDDEYDEEDYDEESDEDEDDEEYEEEEGRSLFVPILSAVTIVVIIVMVILLANLVVNWMNRGRGSNTEEEWQMPNLIGMDYTEATQQYGDKLKIEVESYEYSSLLKDKIFEQSVPENDPVSKGDTVKVKVSKGARTITLPDYTNWDYETAKTQIVGLGLVVDPRYSYNDTVAKDKIISTNPVALTEVEPGAYITVTISKGQNKNTVPVPNFIGMTYEKAQETADLYKLKLTKVEGNSSEAAGIVIDQSINPTEDVTEDTVIKLTVSNGVPVEQEVKVSFAIPANAKGTFHITFYEGGVAKTVGPSFNVDYANGVTSVTVSGIGKVDMLAILSNDANDMKAPIGTYTVNFDSKTAAAIGADITAAFRNVGGLQEETTTTHTTTHTTTTTSHTTSHSTTSTTKANGGDGDGGQTE